MIDMMAETPEVLFEGVLIFLGKLVRNHASGQRFDYYTLCIHAESFSSQPTLASILGGAGDWVQSSSISKLLERISALRQKLASSWCRRNPRLCAHRPGKCSLCFFVTPASEASRALLHRPASEPRVGTLNKHPLYRELKSCGRGKPSSVPR
ncbi:hypothetical protein BDY19DRAFT_295742 [Irpex rosettiformis]|uniref:Uncharacterized protein n=1 Tax=Irpex rosettiformis TaxID=378272 RepID=A0ACB8UIH9_9APHY|nr:hypothetical protein BDY19DRAFT_295742 [Irpex rosettiformis]